MLAQFSIYPTQAEHMSPDVAQAIKTLEGTGLTYRLGPMSTCVEGDLEQVLSAIRRCHEAVASHHKRVITTVVIDDRREEPHHMGEMITSVEKQVGHKVKT